MIELSEQTVIDQVVDRLTQTYPAVPPSTVSSVVHGVHARFDGRPLRDYIPLFVERIARTELAGLTA